MAKVVTTVELEYAELVSLVQEKAREQLNGKPVGGSKVKFQTVQGPDGPIADRVTAIVIFEGNGK